MADYKFPNEFMFGASTAAYQIEGACKEYGKGENIWDRLIHSRSEIIQDGTNADIACDSYHKYKEDIALAKQLNLNFYRFSISWSRIAPTGEMNSLNQEGIAYYNRVIDELIANDIIPLVVMYHFDLPQYLQNFGGWVNPIISDYFKEYARVLFTYFGDRVKWWITFNEPKVSCEGYRFDTCAPCVHLDSTGYYMAAHTQLIAHGKAYRLYENMFKEKQQGKISISISGQFSFPKNSDLIDDMNTAERANQFEMGWFSHPMFKGDYPPVMRELADKQSKKEGRPFSTLPTFTKDEIELIKGSADFYCINYYTSRLVTRGNDPDSNDNPDAEFIASADESWQTCAAASWIKVVPDGLKQILSWIKKEYGNPPLIITENGFGDDGKFNDTDRINYINSHLNAVLNAIHEDGCNVIGYTVWSLLDNFEWTSGYATHFGLVNVDFSDPERSRKPKESFTFLQKVISTRQLTAE